MTAIPSTAQVSVIQPLKPSAPVDTDPNRRYRAYWTLAEALKWMGTWARYQLNQAGMARMREVAALAHALPDALENRFFELKTLDDDVGRLHKLIFSQREPSNEFLQPSRAAVPPVAPAPWRPVFCTLAGLLVGMPLGAYAIRFI